jgi:hypothetical protein
MANDDARTNPHGAHRGTHIESMLDKAIRTFGFIRIAPAPQVKREKRPSPRQSVGNADEVHV